MRILLGIFAFCSVCWADLYYEQVSRVESGQGGETAEEVRLRIFVQSDKIRIEYPKGSQIVVAQLKKGVVWSINEHDATYAEATFDAIAASWQETRREKGIKEDAKGIAFTQRGTGDTKIMQYPCKHYVISNGEETLLEVWVAESLDFPEKDALYEFRTKMGEFSPVVLNEVKRIRGFPLRMIGAKYLGGKKITALREVTSIKQEKIDPKKFELPAGLKKITAGGE